MLMPEFTHRVRLITAERAKKRYGYAIRVGHVLGIKPNTVRQFFRSNIEHTRSDRKNSNKLWSQSEQRELKRLWRTAMSANEIGMQLGRTAHAVYRMAALIGIKRPQDWRAIRAEAVETKRYGVAK